MTKATTNQALLTIAIPTYNRSLYLDQLLSELSEQCTNRSSIAIIVSDNASTDNTEQVVERAIERGLPLSYTKNSSNLGADGNILQCFELATGKYVWIIGDDDVLVPGCINKVMAYLESKEYDLIYVNSIAFEGIHKPNLTSKNERAEEIDDVHVFVKRVSVFLTFISGNIINKNRILQSGPIDFTPLIGTNLVQMGWIYTALNGYMRGLYIREKLVGMRTDNTGDYKLIQVFGPNLNEVTKKWLHNPRLGRLIINGTLRRFWPGMLVKYQRSLSPFKPESNPKKLLTQTYKTYSSYWFFVYPILAAPSIFRKPWWFVTRILNKIDSAL